MISMVLGARFGIVHWAPKQVATRTARARHQPRPELPLEQRLVWSLVSGFLCVFSWFVLGGLSFESHVFVCALFCKARCTCTCCLVLGDMFRLEGVSARVCVNTCNCGTGLASMCLTCTCTTIYAMRYAIALFRNTWWLSLQCFLAPPDILMMLALMC